MIYVNIFLLCGKHPKGIHPKYPKLPLGWFCPAAMLASTPVTQPCIGRGPEARAASGASAAGAKHCVGKTQMGRGDMDEGRVMADVTHLR